MLRDIVPSNREGFIKLLSQSETGKESSLLLFVQGFNVTFAGAALRTAQLAHDLHFPGKVKAYSWPSVGDVGDCWKDEDGNRISTARFRKLLADLLGHQSETYLCRR